jgi:PIN domain nuclease of toxin-antitoxin system
VTRVRADAHGLPWRAGTARKRSPRVRRVIAGRGHAVLISVAALGELTRTRCRGWPDTARPPATIADTPGLARLGTTRACVEAFRALSPWHDGPFDRLPIAQTVAEDRPVVVADRDRRRDAVEFIR